MVLRVVYAHVEKLLESFMYQSTWSPVLLLSLQITEGVLLHPNPSFPENNMLKSLTSEFGGVPPRPLGTGGDMLIILFASHLTETSPLERCQT